MAGMNTTWSATPYYAGVDLNDPAAREAANYAAHIGLVNFQNQFQGDPRNQPGPIPTFGNPYNVQFGTPFAQDAGPNSFGGTPNAIFQQQMARNFQGQPGNVNATNVKPGGYQAAKPAAKKGSVKAGGPPAPQQPQMTAAQQNERNAKWARKGNESMEQETRRFLQENGVTPSTNPEQYAQHVAAMDEQNRRLYTQADQNFPGGGMLDQFNQDLANRGDPYGKGFEYYGQQEVNPETQQQLNDLGTVQSRMRYNQARAKKGIEPDLGSLSPEQIDMYNQQLGYQAANQPQRAPAMRGMNGVGGGNRQGLIGPGAQQVPTLANNPTAVANGLANSGIFMRPKAPGGGQQPAAPQYPQGASPGSFAPQPTGNDLYGDPRPGAAGRPGRTAPQAPTGYVPRPDPRMGIPTRNTGTAPIPSQGFRVGPPSNQGGSFGGAYGNPANQGGFGGGGPALTFGGNQANYGGYGQPQGGGGMMNNLPGILGGLGIQPSGRTTTTTTQRMPTQRYVTTNQRQFTY